MFSMLKKLEATERLKNLVRNFKGVYDPARLAKIAEEIANGANVNTLYAEHPDETPSPLLNVAIRRSKDDIGDAIACALIDAGAKVNTQDYNWNFYTALHQAIESCRVAVVKKLMTRADLQIEVVDNLGITPLHLAVHQGISCAGHETETQALWLSRLEIIKILLGSRASLYGSKFEGTSRILNDVLRNAPRAESGGTAGVAITTEYGGCKTIVHLLVQKLIELNLLGIRCFDTGYNVGLMFLRNAIFDQDLDLMRMILKVDPIFFLPADIYAFIFKLNKKASLPLIIDAIKHGSGDVVSALLEDVNAKQHLAYARDYLIQVAKDHAGTELDLLANFFGYFKEIRGDALAILKVFLEAGLDIHVRDSKGNSLLHLAAEYKYESVYIYLSKLDIAADLNLPNNEGKTPRDITLASQSVETMAMGAWVDRYPAVMAWVTSWEDSSPFSAVAGSSGAGGAGARSSTIIYHSSGSSSAQASGGASNVSQPLVD